MYLPQVLSPEVHRLGRQFRRDFLHFRLNKETVLGALAKLEYSFVGMGSEHVVFRQTTDSAEVISINFAHPKDRVTAKVEYYAQRIFWLLFPHNFPHFSAAYGTMDPLLASITYRQFVKNVLGYEAEKYQDVDVLSRYPFAWVLQSFKDLRFPVIFDYSEGNYGLGSDGGTYYYDHPITHFGRLRKEQLITLESHIFHWMITHAFSGQRIEQVIKSYRRIMELSVGKK